MAPILSESFIQNVKKAADRADLSIFYRSPVLRRLLEWAQTPHIQRSGE